MGAGGDLILTSDGTNGTIFANEGDLTLDSAGDIVLDADGADIQLKDAGVATGRLGLENGDLNIATMRQDFDMKFKGMDGNTTPFTALTLSMGNAGAATFNSTVLASGGASDNNDTAAVFKGTGSEHIKLLLDTSSSGGHQASIALESNGTQVSIGTTGSGELRHITNGAERFRIAVDGSLSTPTAGTDNVRFGENAGNSIASGGIRNVLIGKNAGTAITTGDSNVAVGWEALKTEDTHANSVAIGASALATQNAGADAYNVAVGYNAGIAVTTGTNNTLIGASSGLSITSATSNVHVGADSGKFSTTGAQNTFVGYRAAQGITGTKLTGNNNTAIGYQSGLLLQGAATLNTFVGVDSGVAVTTGVNNTYLGALAGDGTDDGDGNTAVGKSALSANCGDSNVAVGLNALIACTNNNNTAVGTAAGDNITGGTQNTLIGAQVEAEAAGSNNCIGLGFNIVAGAGFTTLGIDANDIRAAHGNVTWATVSDQRYKKDIADSTAGLSFINALQPRTFKYKNLGELPTAFRAYEADSTAVFKNSNINHGFIAQEVKAAIDADSSIKDGFTLWDSRDDGSQEVAEAALIPILVKAIQELTARITTLEG